MSRRDSSGFGNSGVVTGMRKLIVGLVLCQAVSTVTCVAVSVRTGHSVAYSASSDADSCRLAIESQIQTIVDEQRSATKELTASVHAIGYMVAASADKPKGMDDLQSRLQLLSISVTSLDQKVSDLALQVSLRASRPRE